MCPLEYLSVLNSETKEKLVGICLDRKIFEPLNDEETMDGEEIDEDESAEEIYNLNIIN